MTVGRNLERDTIYDLRTEMLDQNGDAVTLADGAYTLENIGNAPVLYFDAAAKPANADGLFPHRLKPGAHIPVSLNAQGSLFAFTVFSSSTVAVTPAE